MNISQINTRAISFSPENYKTKNVPENNESNAKPLTNEISSAVEVSLSSEGINLSTARLEEIKLEQLPQSSIRNVEFQIKLMQEAKRQRLDGESSGDNIKDLASAYAVVSSNLNENSDSSQKHIKFLDDAFKAVSDYYFTTNAQQQVKGDSFANVLQSGISDNELSAKLKEATGTAKNQSSVFSDAFLKNFKKQGLEGAYNLAISLLK